MSADGNAAATAVPLRGVDIPVSTTCPYCGVGCGVLATPRADSRVEIAGDPDHPANFGRLCVKGSALGETLGDHGRLLYPSIDGRRVGWDAAIDRVARGFAEAIATHGSDSVAFYVSGQLLTEDYYVANKLMKGYLGSANIDTNSRLCMSSAVAGYVRAFGEDVVPCDYTDLEVCDLLVLVGANLAWCHPILFQRIAAARARRPQMKLVVIDPRRTATCEDADLHLAIRPGSDVWLFDGLLRWLHAQGGVDPTFLDAHTGGCDAALQATQGADDPAVVARECGLDETQVRAFYALFAAHDRTVTAFSMGVNQSSAGTDKVNAIINVHLLTGRLGRAGTGPFSITGQPNAMGGREVGGLANLLAAHRTLEDPSHREAVQAFWRSPAIASRPGLKAVELFEAVEAGRIQALWIMATNPVVSLPDADQIKRALARCPLVVVSDCIAVTDTTAFAHVLLPATGWSEKDGTVTNTERRISRQRAVLAPAGEARHDWRIVCDVARRMGFEAGFGYTSAAEIFDEHARLANGEGIALDLRGLAGMAEAEYEALRPVQWPIGPAACLPHGRDSVVASATKPTASAGPGERRETRVFADGRFPTPDGRARFVATPPRGPAHAPDDEFPLILNTGRVRDHWHTMTRTGRAPTLAGHRAEPFVEIHPDDAQRAALVDGALAEVRSRWGLARLRVRCTPSQRRGELFVPIHWTAQTASAARVGALVNPIVDPVSGEPEFKHTPVAIVPFEAAWYGFLLTRSPFAPDADLWWALARGRDHARYELAGSGSVADWSAQARRWLGAGSAPAADEDWIELSDKAAGTYRAARLVEERLESLLFVARDPAVLPPRDRLAARLAEPALDPAARATLLAGRGGRAAPDAGAIVCSCFGVGRNTIVETIRTHRCTDPQTVGQRLKAGTNCGSCVPEIRMLIAQLAPPRPG